MPEFAVNSHRLDPYGHFRFRVEWDGRYVPGVSRVSEIGWTLTPERDGKPAGLLPGGTPIPLAGGIGLLGQILDPLGVFGGGGLAGALLGSDVPENYEPPALRPALQPLRLERGRTHDRAFEDWAAAVTGADSGSSRVELAKTVRIELLNEAGQLSLAFKLSNCIPLAYFPLGALDANREGIAIETLVLGYEAFGRDLDVPEPVEPSFEP